MNAAFLEFIEEKLEVLTVLPEYVFHERRFLVEFAEFAHFGSAGQKIVRRWRLEDRKLSSAGHLPVEYGSQTCSLSW